MDKEGIHFCSECHNLSYIFLQEKESEDSEEKVQELIYKCKLCGNIEPYDGENNCIYNSTFADYDISRMINTNQYITHDKTLPSIKGNENFKCPNEECNAQGGDKSFKYIKYNVDDMKYIYICEKCGQKWNN